MTSSELLTRPGAPGPRGRGGGRNRSRRPLRLRAAAPAALGAGLLGYLAFPGHDLWALAPLGVAGLVLALRGQRARVAALLGWVFGVAMVVPLISWTGVYLGPIAHLPLSAVEGLYYALAGVLIALVQRLPWAGAPGAAARAAGSAGAWVAAEALQGRWPFGGFEWTRLAFSQTDAPTLGLAALGGAPLVSFAVVAAGALLAEALDPRTAGRRPGRRPGARPGRRGRAGALAAALGVLGAGALVPTPVAAQSGVLDVAAVQGDVPTAGLDFNAQRRAVLDNHVRGTRTVVEDVAAGGDRPDLVVWPENASDIDPFTNADAAALIDDVVTDLGAPVLLGTLVHRADGRIDNTSLLWEPGVGASASYVKRHPVPFAEYIPYRSFFRMITKKVDLQRTPFAAGTQVGAIDVAGARLGTLICFEVVDDALVADVVDAGASLLVVQTNNATFGYTDESVQQLAMSRLRAVETGRAVVHVSTVGVSALVLPDGTATQATDLFTPAVLRAQLPLRTEATAATALRGAGVPVEALLAGGGLLAAAAALLGTRAAGPRTGRGRAGGPGRAGDVGRGGEDNTGRSHLVV